MTEVAVLGCGPAGMLAAHAAAMVFDRVDIYSKPVRSHIGGAQYLHEAIPLLTSTVPDSTCELIKVGTAPGYSHKVYGAVREDISWYRYGERRYNVWNLREAYERTWHLYKEWIRPLTLDPGIVRRLNTEYQFVISSIPLYELVPEDIRDRFGFHWQTVWITQAPLIGGSNYIEYNGNPDVPYYRRSVLFDTEGFEYGARHLAPNEAVTVRKPLGCEKADHVMPSVHKVGRYGTFQKTKLAHHAYVDTLEIITKHGRPPWVEQYMQIREASHAL